MQLLLRSWFRCMLQNKKAPLHRIVSKKTPKVSSSFNQIWKVKMSKLSEFTSFYRIYPIYILFLHILHIFWHLHYIKSFWHIENLTQRMVKLWSEVVELKKWSKMVKLQRWTKGGQLKARQGAAHGESEEGGGASGFLPNWKAIEGAVSALSASYIARKTWHLAAIIFLCGDTLWDQFLHRLWVTNKNVLP